MATFTIPLLAVSRRDGVPHVMVSTNLPMYPPFANLEEEARGDFLLTMLGCARDGGRSTYCPGLHAAFRDAGLIVVEEGAENAPSGVRHGRSTRVVGNELRGNPRNEHAVVMFTFPCNGMISEVQVFSDFVDELARLFPSVDVASQTNKALAWILANPDRRKTARGMRAFLTRWFDRAQTNGTWGR